MSSLGSSVVALHVTRPVTIPAAGMTVSFSPVSSWAAVVIAHQNRGSARLIGNDFTGVGIASDGRRTAAQGFGSATKLPAGWYALYVLAPTGYRITARISLPGVVQSDVALWSRRHVPTTAHLEQQLASSAGLTNRVAIGAKQPSGLVVLGNTMGGPFTHDLAVCLVEGAVPRGAEMLCGSPGLTTYREDADMGAGDGSIALLVPTLPSQPLTAVLRAEANGLGTGLAINALQWAWTAPATTAVA